MNFLEKLEFLMEQKNIANLHDLSKKSGIPYSTLRGFYTKGYDNIKRPTLKKMKEFFGCTIDYLCDDDVIVPNTYFPPDISSDNK